MVHDPHYADACVVVGVRGHLRVWKLPVYNQVMTTVSKHQADSRLIMVFGPFYRVLAVSSLAFARRTRGYQHFNLDFHRPYAAD
jgi:succinyl-CoA synthetase alpha subunit